MASYRKKREAYFRKSKGIKDLSREAHSKADGPDCRKSDISSKKASRQMGSPRLNQIKTQSNASANTAKKSIKESAILQELFKLPNVIDMSGLLSCIDTDLLRSEVIEAEKAHEFTNKTKHWSSIPLRSANGVIGEPASRSYGIYNSPDPDVYRDTSVMGSTPYIKSILDEIGAPILKVRILKLVKGKAIGEHLDGFQSDDIVRLHIPIVTHPNVEFWIDNECYYIEPNKLSYINVRKRHKVINRSPIDRIHLVFDVKWTGDFPDRFRSISNKSFS